MTHPLDLADDPAHALAVRILPSAAGEVTAFLVDRSREQAAAAALFAMPETFRRLVEGTPDVVAVHQHGMFVFVNPAMVRILGYDDASELIGTPVLDIVHPADRPVVVQRMRALQRDGIEALPIEERFLRKDGTILYAEARAICVELGAGPAIVVIARDSTERRRLQAQVRLAERMAAVGRIAVNVAHELNNPLSVVLCNLDTVLADLPTLAAGDAVGEITAMLGEVRAAALQVRRAVRDLSLVAGPASTALTWTDLVPVVEAALRLTNREALAGGELETDLQPTPPVPAHAAHLGQLVLQLLAVAWAGTANEGSRGRVRLATSAAADHVLLTATSSASAPSPSALAGLQDAVQALGGELEAVQRGPDGAEYRVMLPLDLDPASR